MADEIAQVAEIECKGAYYLLKGTKEMIALMGQFIRKMYEWEHEKWLNKPGNISWQKLLQVSDGVPPILEFPKEMFEESIPYEGEMISPFELYCIEHDLRYCMMPDLNESDDYVPVAVVAQDMGIHQEQIKSFMNLRIETEEVKDKDYEERIAKLREIIGTAGSEEEREAAKKEMAVLLDAKQENAELLAESKTKLEHDNILDFANYLKQCEGSVMEKDMDLAFDQLRTSGLAREFTPEECMMPIRDEALVPESREIYYSQIANDNSVYTVKRDFAKDKDGIVYSTYHVTSGDNAEKEVVFTDQGFTKEEWKAQLPMLLKESGMVADAPTIALPGQARMRAYLDGIERNFTKARSESGEESGNLEGSSKEVTEFLKEAKERRELKDSYDHSMYTTFTVPAAAVMPSGEQVTSLELSEGLVEGITVERMDSEKAIVTVKEDATYRLERPDGSHTALMGTDILSEVLGKQAESKDRVIARSRK